MSAGHSRTTRREPEREPVSDGGDKGGSITLPRAWLPYVLTLLIGGGGATAVNRWIVPPSDAAGQQYLEKQFEDIKSDLRGIKSELHEFRRDHVTIGNKAAAIEARVDELLKRRR